MRRHDSKPALLPEIALQRRKIGRNRRIGQHLPGDALHVDIANFEIELFQPLPHEMREAGRFIRRQVFQREIAFPQLSETG